MTLSKEYAAAWRAKNREKIRAYANAWWKRNTLVSAAHRERQRARSTVWKRKNAEKVAEYQKEYRLAHPEYTLAIKEWRAQNKERLQGYWAKHGPVNNATRRATKLAATCDCCAPISFRFIYLQARSLKMHVDHVRPLAKGGKHCLRNLQLLEPVDNMRKGASYAEPA